jgi:hypothetical protein
MALFKSTQVTNNQPPLSASGADDLVPVFGDFTIPSGFASGDVVEFGALPLGYVPVDIIIDHEDLGGTMTGNAGLLSGEYNASGARTCGAEFISGGDFSTAAGIKRMTAAGGGRIAPTTYASVAAGGATHRGWGMTFSTVTTPTVGAKIRATLLVRTAIEAA